MHCRIELLIGTLVVATLALASPVQAAPGPDAAGTFLSGAVPTRRVAPTRGAVRAHGPRASDEQFPSHVFRFDAQQPERVQLAFHAGLLQPLLLHGFNAAVDVRYKRLVLTYSHGEGLDVTPFVGTREKAASMTLSEPFTTGGGVGALLFDEVWLLADFKVHQFDASTALDRASYTTVTVGAELGWRYFLWKGFNVGVVARYWPTVYSTAGTGVTLRGPGGVSFVHQPQAQGFGGFFGNVLVGWAFDL